MQLSAASARSPRRLLKLTLIVLAAGALVTPALGLGPEGEGPPAPTGLGARDATTTTLTWDWKADETTTSYRVFVDGRFVASTASQQVTLDALECGRAYALAVEAVDAAGRRSPVATVIASSAPCASAADPQPAPTSQPASVETPQRPGATSAPTSRPQVPTTREQITPAQTAPASPPPSIWQTAGAFVWHEAAVDPEALGHQLKENGFGWVAVQLHDGLSVDPVQDDWIRRFRDASGLPVGGWGVLRTEPVAEARLAQTLLARYSLDFYIADAEAEYKYSSDTGFSDVRYARSRQFVDAFRSGLPEMPAAVSSYCRADREDIDWQSWANGRFDFLPQAYVNDLGDRVSPAACTEGAAKWFSVDAIHPTIGTYASNDPQATPATYAKLLQAAHTVGFSVYLAETQDDPQAWNVLGQAIGDLGIARELAKPAADRGAGA